MDALSDVLQAVRLTGAVFFDVHARDPWVAEAPAGAQIVKRIFPDADHLVPYHVVTSGACWGSVDGEAPVPLSAGDIIVFPHGDAHRLASAPGMQGTADLTLYQRPAEGQLPFSLTVGSGPHEAAHVVCGYLGCDARPFNPLLAGLPRVIHIGDRGKGAIRTFVEFALREARDQGPGAEVVLGRLSELMFVDVIRRYVETLPSTRTGWLAGLREPYVSRALAALHRSPSRSWTLESLAHEVGLSRSALAERFTHYVGQPPMQYLASWRMQLAATYLSSGSDGVAAIADRVGYESEAAFSRAFKKSVGVSPGQWRKRRRSGPARECSRTRMRPPAR